MRRATIVGVAVLAVLAVTRSQPPPLPVVRGSWPMYQRRPDHNAVFATPDWRVRWTATVKGRINGGLAVVGTTLFAGTMVTVKKTEGFAYAFDARTGAVRWMRRIGRPTMSAAIVADGLVFFGTGTNDVLFDRFDRVVWGSHDGDAVVALDATYGWPVWRFRTVGEDMPSAAVVRDGDRTIVVVANGDDHVYGLDAHTGAIVWKRDTFGVATMDSLASDGRTIVGLFNRSDAYSKTTASNERLYRLRASTWALDTATHAFRWMVPFGNADCSPTLAGDSIYEESERRVHPAATDVHSPAVNVVAALDARTGAVRWRYTSGPGRFTSAGSSEEAVAGLYAGGTYYTSMPYPREFAAFDARTGRLRWKIRTSAPVKMSAVTAFGRLYFGDTGGTLYVVAARDGRIVRRQRFTNIFDAAPPVVIGHTLYLPNGNHIVALPIA